VLTTLGKVVVTLFFALETPALVTAEADGEDTAVGEDSAIVDPDLVPPTIVSMLSEGRGSRDVPDVEYAAADSDTAPLVSLSLLLEAVGADISSAAVVSDFDWC
jgi:hypothetical protein